jgi:glutamyl-tRNA synthetase/nondiscriminating glutamyl-tRNA synthetase
MANPEQKNSLIAQSAEFFIKAGYLESGDPKANDWLSKLMDLFVPAVNKLDELPEKAALLFKYDATAAIAAPDNAEVMNGPNTPKVLGAFAAKITAEPGPLTAERFKAIVNEVKTEAGVKGKDLFHPIRTAITGSHSGPEFDKLIPLIEEGAQLQLPTHVLSVKERVEAFQRARNQ